MIRALIVAALLMALPSQTFAACTLGGANTDVITVAAAATINNLATRFLCQWNRPTSDTGLQVFIAKVAQSDFKRLSAGDPNDFNARVARAVTNAASTSTGVDRPLNTWQALCATHADGTAPQIFRGTETAAMAETAYATQLVGLGAYTDDAAAALLIGNDVTLIGAFVGQVAVSVIGNTAPTAAALDLLMRRPRGRAQVVMLQLAGLPTCSGTQGDWSGNGNTGAPSLNSTTVAAGPVINYRHPGAGRRR